MSETTACTCSKPDCARCTWHAAADVFAATGDHDRCAMIVARAINAGVDRSREEWGDGYCQRQHADEEWLDDQIDRAYRAGWDRAVQMCAKIADGGNTILAGLLLAHGPNPTDQRLDLERVAQENP